ncbi:MAG: Trm112 family protein [bacterium]
MAIDKQLLEILCCPKTHVPLSILPSDSLQTINENIALGKIKYADGSIVDQPLQEGLITEDGLTIYRVDDEIPIMLPDKGIPVTNN